MEFFKEWWAVLGGTGAAVLWLGRLEAAGRTALREIDRLDRQIEADRRAAVESRKETNDMLREMRGDIKSLLRK